MAVGILDFLLPIFDWVGGGEVAEGEDGEEGAEEAGELDGAEVEERGFAGFEKFDGEAEKKIAGEVEAEARANGDGAAAHDDREGGREREHKEGFVELGGMAADAVAEIDAPRERCREAVGAIGEAGKEAADPPDGGAEGEGPDEGVAGGADDAADFFRELHAGPAAEEATDDGLAAEERGGIVGGEGEVVLRGFGPSEELGAGPRAERSADEQPEVGFEWERSFWGAAAEGEIDAGADEIDRGRRETSSRASRERTEHNA
jgi:hypothetical protein